MIVTVALDLHAELQVDMSVSIVAKNTCPTTGEGPYWEESSKSLVYVDIVCGDVHHWSSLTNEDTSLHLGLMYFIYVQHCYQHFHDVDLI